jgi:hypothetical protein
MLDPQQELFIRIKTDIEALGFAVYDGVLPPEDTPYPFVYLDGFRMSDEENKTAVFGRVFPTIHVWHNNPKQRGSVSSMLLKIKTAIREIERTEHFGWGVRAISQNIITDTTTKAPLLHGYLDVEIQFS